MKNARRAFESAPLPSCRAVGAFDESDEPPARGDAARREVRARVQTLRHRRADDSTRGYALSLHTRMQNERIFGWIESVAGLRRTRSRGRRKTRFAAYLVGAAYDLLRVARLRQCAG